MSLQAARRPYRHPTPLQGPPQATFLPWGEPCPLSTHCGHNRFRGSSTGEPAEEIPAILARRQFRSRGSCGWLDHEVFHRALGRGACSVVQYAPSGRYRHVNRYCLHRTADRRVPRLFHGQTAFPSDPALVPTFHPWAERPLSAMSPSASQSPMAGSSPAPAADGRPDISMIVEI